MPAHHFLVLLKSPYALSCPNPRTRWILIVINFYLFSNLSHIKIFLYLVSKSPSGTLFAGKRDYRKSRLLSICFSLEPCAFMAPSNLRWVTCHKSLLMEAKVCFLRKHICVLVPLCLCAWKFWLACSTRIRIYFILLREKIFVTYIQVLTGCILLFTKRAFAHGVRKVISSLDSSKRIHMQLTPFPGIFIRISRDTLFPTTFFRCLPHRSPLPMASLYDESRKNIFASHQWSTRPEVRSTSNMTIYTLTPTQYHTCAHDPIHQPRLKSRITLIWVDYFSSTDKQIVKIVVLTE